MMDVSQNEIYIFLGPTLSVNEAKHFLPEANYLPPVRCGDLFRILQKKTKNYSYYRWNI